MKTRAAYIEKLLNVVKVHPQVSVGELLSTSLHLKLRKGSIGWYQLLVAFKILLFPKKKVLKIYQWKEGAEESHKILIGLAAFSNRCLGFFKDLVNSETDRNFDLTVPKNDSNFKLKLSHTLDNSSIPFRVIKEIFLIKGISLSEKLVIASLTQIQWLKWKSCRELLSNYQYATVLTEFDRYTSNAPLILAARSLGIPNATLVHGATNPIDHYVPILADQIWLWGQYHVEQFSQHHDGKLKMIKVGNPKVSVFRNKRIRHFQKIGLGMTVLPEKDRNKLLEIFINGSRGFESRLIKMHPKESSTFSSRVSRGENVKILGGETSAEEFLRDIDVLCVRRSQIGSDALSYDIPIIICDGIDAADMQNGEVLHDQAGCPIVEDADALESELELLQNNIQYLERRLRAQKEYFDRLYSYTASESVREMETALNRLL